MHYGHQRQQEERKLPHENLSKKVAASISDECTAFIDALLHPNPALRLGVITNEASVELHEVPFLKPLDFEKLLRGEVPSTLNVEKIKQKGQKVFSGTKPQFDSYAELEGSTTTVTRIAENFGDLQGVGEKKMRRYENTLPHGTM